LVDFLKLFTLPSMFANWFDPKTFSKMTEKLPFGEGASINKPPLFCGLNYQFWKVRMKIFVESIDRGIWNAIINGSFVPKFEKR